MVVSCKLPGHLLAIDAPDLLLLIRISPEKGSPESASSLTFIHQKIYGTKSPHNDYA